MDVRRLALFALASLLVAPLVAAGGDTGAPQPTHQMCRSASIDAPSNQPIQNWIIIDPDGCFTNMAHRLLDYVVSYVPW